MLDVKLRIGAHDRHQALAGGPGGHRRANRRGTVLLPRQLALRGRGTRGWALGIHATAKRRVEPKQHKAGYERENRIFDQGLIHRTLLQTGALSAAILLR
jgi:hypothetical protein